MSAEEGCWGGPLTEDVILSVEHERIRQNAKWGLQEHDPAAWLVILGEEYGEACRAALEGELDDLETELVQVAAVAAVAVAAVECIRRHKSDRYGESLVQVDTWRPETE